MTCQQRVRISDLCVIQSGYASRHRLAPADGEGVPVIKLQDVSPSGRVRLERLGRVRNPLRRRYFVRAGDVIFRPRGHRNTAWALDDRYDGRAAVLNPLFILRPRRQLVLPDFLAWAINQPQAQHHFDRVARGTNLRMVLRPGLETLEIGLPDLETQGRIVAVAKLARRERELAMAVAEKRASLVRRVLGDLADPRNRSDTPFRSGD